MKYTLILLLALFSLIRCNTNSNSESLSGNSDTSDSSQVAITDASKALPLNTIILPPGFSISVYAEVNNARSMARSPSGILYVSNRSGDRVYAVKDTDGDHKADKRWVIAKGLNMPNGVAFRDGSLYVAEVNRILRYDNIEQQLHNPPTPVVISDTYPTDAHHGWKYIAFGPDGKLYVPVGAPCNICDEEDEIYASITRINADGTGREVFAHGVRNTVGFTWHPETNEMWFTDNGRDNLGDDIPPCELNRAPEAGMHFGYPYCHAGTIKDPEFGNIAPCSDFIAPAKALGPHTAPLGLKFYTGSMFPESYRNDLFIAEHGSWNRSSKIGYRVMHVNIENNTAATEYEPFAYGWLDEEKQTAWGRPVDVLILPDGSMLVSDDKAGVIYRISYTSK